jgi:peptide/nickel transport system substrate-binding protein
MGGNQLMKRYKSMLLLLIFSMIISACMDNSSSSPDGTSSVGENESTENESNKTDETNDSEITDFAQSPMLNEMDLPPVEERLPDVPKITNEMDSSQLDYEIGEYGGTLSVISSNPDSSDNLFVMLNEPIINTPGLLGETFTGNVVEDFEVNEDETEFTFYMREGLKWSDGEPVNTEDVRFTYEDVYLNEELTPFFPAKYRTAGDPSGEPMNLEIVDDYTFRITFEQPYGGFLMRIAIQGWEGYSSLIKPEHFLRDFHKDYADETTLANAVEEAGYEEGEWFNLFHEKDIIGGEFTSTNAIGFPSLNPWLIVENADGLQTYDRNPYYFKVDMEGNQLPYIDHAESIYVQDKEMENLEIISGNVDYVRSDLSNVALYKENEENGGYKVVLRNQHSRPGNIMFNHTFEDEAWQSAIQDVRFREALNLGMNNEEIIDAIYLTFAEIPSDYNSGEYDPDRANELLDEMGMDERDSEGHRLAPNGEELQINIEVFEAAEYIPQAELLVEY